MNLKAGDVFVQDAGDGFKFYRIVTGISEDGYPHGVSIAANASGAIFSLTVEGIIFESMMRQPGTSKYGEPIPVELPEAEPVAA